MVFQIRKYALMLVSAHNTRKRLEDAQRQLNACPHSWYWQVRVKILRFIVSVYGPATYDLETGSVPRKRSANSSIQVLHPYVPRLEPAQIRALLQRIADWNPQP